MVKEVPNVIKYLAGAGIIMALVAMRWGLHGNLLSGRGGLVEDTPPKVFFFTPKSDHTRAFLDKAL